MPLSIPNLKFLLDENVRRDLFRFLKSKYLDVKSVPKSASDMQVAQTSLSEKRVLVTNDEDFSEYSKDKIFVVIWLRIPQHEGKSLISSFEKMLKEVKKYEEKIIILTPKGWDEFPLLEEIAIM